MLKIIVAAILVLPSLSAANELSEAFQSLSVQPKITISSNKSGWPKYEIESTKYKLLILFGFDKNIAPTSHFLLKEHQITEVTDGIEGARSEIVFELWALGTNEVGKRIWRFSEKAHTWKWSGRDEMVLIKYGCCSDPHVHKYYSVRTGKFLRMKKVKN